MDPNFWQKYAVGGATRPDSFSGMNPQFNSSLQRMFTEAPPEIQSQLKVMSGYRSPERQKQLWDQALVKYGSPEAARKWVAPPGNSQHNHGNASDLRFGNDAARQWAHENANRYGLQFPLSNENWHIELQGARDGHHPVQATAPAPQPMPGQQPPAQVLGRNFADMYAQAPAAPGIPTGDYNPLQVADASMPALGALFLQQQAAKQDKRKEEQEADAVRKAALFAPPPRY